ncbi:MAG: iron-sulfur cluster assembly protein [Chitinophagales bacterium]|jgi:iron-sulfur cluster assembly protein
MSITLTENAAKQVLHLLAQHGKGIALRIGIKKVGCTGLAHTFDIADQILPTDHSFEAYDAQVLIDADSLPFLDGSHIDFVTEGLKQMFKFDNPNVDSECGCGESFNLKKSTLSVKSSMVTP